jgi:predicted flap endonuclease-1-like 5' DNA nuclease
MKTKVTFTLSAEIVGDATGGVIVGEFNDWNQAQGVALKKSKDGLMKATVQLEAGQTYQYRYLLDDGRWVNDDNAPNQHDNCVLTVPVETQTQNDCVDDLTKIRGVGKKIAQLLIDHDIQSFASLAQTPLKRLKEILDEAGNRSKIYDPTHWAKQAKLAAAGKWDELKKLQADLKK